MAAFDGKKKDFDLEIVRSAFQRCHQTDGIITVEEYLEAFTELCRFFKLTGTLFGFVAMDLEEKIKILQNHRKADSENYFSVQSMTRYEVDNDLTKAKVHNMKSGSRTLLRLHRALEFILAFMTRLQTGDENEKSSTIASEVYYETLARFHPWLIQKMASVAMYMLPSKKNLIDVMCVHDYETVVRMLKEVVEAGTPVYNVTQRVYSEQNLLELP